MNQYPCSGCGSRHCDGRCFLECAADYDDSPVAKLQAWEIATMAAVALFIGFALAVQF